MNKVIIVPKTKSGLSRADIHYHLLQIHGPLAMAYEDVGGQFEGYAHAYVVDGLPDPVSCAPLLECDALSLVKVPSKEVVLATLSSSDYRTHVQPDEDNFGDREGTIVLFADAIELGPPVIGGELKVFLFRQSAKPVRAAALTTWRGCLDGLITRYPSVSYCYNAIEKTDNPGAWDAIDEVVIPEGGLPEGFVTDLSIAASEAFGVDAANAMVTRYHVFK